jgi:SAM-dependent methyltransferase
MTPDMITQSRAHAAKAGFANVDFRLGEIEALPVADGTVDVILSNCVINLSPDKPRVFAESFRALKRGGRLAISDIVATDEIPEAIRKELELLTGCISGAARVEELQSMLKDAGFTDIVVDVDEKSREFIKDWSPESGAHNYVASAKIKATKA